MLGNFSVLPASCQGPDQLLPVLTQFSFWVNSFWDSTGVHSALSTKSSPSQSVVTVGRHTACTGPNEEVCVSAQLRLWPDLLSFRSGRLQATGRLAPHPAILPSEARSPVHLSDSGCPKKLSENRVYFKFLLQK